MPHIAVTMLPGRDRETKQKLAENLCNTLIETLGVDAKFVSVSVEDVEMKEWENSMRRIPAETIIVNPNKKYSLILKFHLKVILSTKPFNFIRDTKQDSSFSKKTV